MIIGQPDAFDKAALILGGFTILYCLFWNQISRLFGQKPVGEDFTNPKFIKSAKMRFAMARVAFTLIGIVWLVLGSTEWLIVHEIAMAIIWFVLGILLLIILVQVGIVLINWRWE